MPEFSVPLDPCNPGHFYACCGLLEIFHLRDSQVLSYFQVDSRHPRQANFVMSSSASLDWTAIVRALKEATYQVRVPVRSRLPKAEKEPNAAIAVSIFGNECTLDWWLDPFHDKATSLKCWAGKVTTKKLVDTLPKLVSGDCCSFDDAVFTTSRFGIDPRSAWVALNLGYSPNEQGHEARTYPLVEILGAFGLQGFRPAGSRSEDFTYHLWLAPLPCLVARTACMQPWNGLKSAAYRFALGERGSYKYFGFAQPISNF